MKKDPEWPEMPSRKEIYEKLLPFIKRRFMSRPAARFKVMTAAPSANPCALDKVCEFISYLAEPGPMAAGEAPTEPYFVTIRNTLDLLKAAVSQLEAREAARDDSFEPLIYGAPGGEGASSPSPPKYPPS